MHKARALYFVSPKKLEIREVELPSIGDEDILVETIYSAVSAGTEMLIYRGQFPHLSDTHDNISQNLAYPLEYGYACVGRIISAGKSVNREALGKLIFAFQPHKSHFVAPLSSVQFLPENIQPESACFLPNMETAVNLIQDGAPILGERVLVLGQGIVGLLVAALLKEFPLECLATVDRYELRRNASAKLGAMSFENINNSLSKIDYAQSKFDLTFELSGSPSAVNDAIQFTLFSGRIVIGSWYGEKRAEINLGGEFHRSRIKMISSQVSTISPELEGRWGKQRRFNVAWDALIRIKPEQWITHRFSIGNAGTAYRLLDENPQDVLQVLFTYQEK